MSMRTWARGVAHHRMELMGYTKMNKEGRDAKGKRIPSIFAQTWWKVLTKGTPHWFEYRKVCARRGVR